MTHVTCRLTAKNRDQIRNPTLSSRVRATFTFLFRRRGDWRASGSRRGTTSAVGQRERRRVGPVPLRDRGKSRAGRGVVPLRQAGKTVRGFPAGVRRGQRLLQPGYPRGFPGRHGQIHGRRSQLFRLGDVIGRSECS